MVLNKSTRGRGLRWIPVEFYGGKRAGYARALHGWRTTFPLWLQREKSERASRRSKARATTFSGRSSKGLWPPVAAAKSGQAHSIAPTTVKGFDVEGEGFEMERGVGSSSVQKIVINTSPLRSLIYNVWCGGGPTSKNHDSVENGGPLSSVPIASKRGFSTQARKMSKDSSLKTFTKRALSLICTPPTCWK